MPKAVIMAGGPGERFWPLTHKKFPKYLIRPNGKNSLLQSTYKRLLGVYAKKDIFVVTTREHLVFIRKELPALGKNGVIVEPERRNTAAAILFSTAFLQSKFGTQEVVSFFPADHLIEREDFFKKTIQKAIAFARNKKSLVTIGVKPIFPATGYGYIQTGAPAGDFSDIFHVRCFKEKPLHRVAVGYLKKINFLWNGGIFTWKTGVFLEAMKKNTPKFYALFNLKNISASYKKLPKLSVDYVLLEKADNIVVVKTSMDWCDMGSWDSFMDKAKKDAQKNHVYGNVCLEESRDSLFINYTKNPLIGFGLRDMIVVQTDQGTLLCRRTHSEEAALLARRHT